MVWADGDCDNRECLIADNVEHCKRECLAHKCNAVVFTIHQKRIFVCCFMICPADKLDNPTLAMAGAASYVFHGYIGELILKVLNNFNKVDFYTTYDCIII